VSVSGANVGVILTAESYFATAVAGCDRFREPVASATSGSGGHTPFQGTVATYRLGSRMRVRPWAPADTPPSWAFPVPPVPMMPQVIGPLVSGCRSRPECLLQQMRNTGPQVAIGSLSPRGQPPTAAPFMQCDTVLR
jgi:hypothetical protein